MNIQSAIIQGTNILKSNYIQTAQLDTEILMAKALGKDRKYIVLNNNKYLEYGKTAKQNSYNFHWDKIIEKYKKILN